MSSPTTSPAAHSPAANAPRFSYPTSGTINILARSRSWVSIMFLLPAGIIAAGSPSWVARDSALDLACQTIGWTAFLAGAVLRWWATLYIGGRKTTELVTGGAYSFCRNPLYLGTFLMQLAVVFLIESLTLGVATLIVATYYIGVTVTAEERRLAGIYGAKFQEYVARVPRLIPSFRSLESPAAHTIEVAGLRAELIRMLRWMWIPAACHLLNVAREQQWWTPLTNWP